MKLLRTVSLHSEQERAEFTSAYAASFVKRGINVRTPMSLEEILSYDHVFGIFSEGRLVAGFIINNRPVRLNYFLKQGQLSMDPKALDLIEGVELSGVWTEGKGKSVLLWPMIMKEIIKLTDHNGVIAAAYSKHGMYNTYMAFNPEIIHNPGNPNELTVFRFTKGQFVLTVMAGTLKRLISLDKFSRYLPNVLGRS